MKQVEKGVTSAISRWFQVLGLRSSIFYVTTLTPGALGRLRMPLRIKGKLLEG